MIPELAVQSLRRIALEMAEAVDAEGYTVDVAMAVNPHFTSGTARAHLLRDIVINAAAAAASRGGVVDYRPVNGTGAEIRCYAGDEDHHMRIRRARRSCGELRVAANSDSALAHVAEPEDFLLIREVHHVLGWHVDAAGKIDEVFVAEILGVDESGRWLQLGTQYPLLEPPEDPFTGTGFEPSDDGLPGFDTGDEEAGDSDYGAGS